MNGKTASKTALTLFATAAILSPTIVVADVYYDFIIDRLAQAAVLAGLGGYTLKDADVNVMTSGSSKYITFTLYPGIEYKFIGVCDQDCRDVDLRLYDERSNLIDSDVKFDDTPIVDVIPRRIANFTVQVSMARCAARDCFYGVGVFFK